MNPMFLVSFVYRLLPCAGRHFKGEMFNMIMMFSKNVFCYIVLCCKVKVADFISSIFVSIRSYLSLSLSFSLYLSPSLELTVSSPYSQFSSLSPNPCATLNAIAGPISPPTNPRQEDSAPRPVPPFPHPFTLPQNTTLSNHGHWSLLLNHPFLSKSCRDG